MRRARAGGRGEERGSSIDYGDRRSPSRASTHRCCCIFCYNVPRVDANSTPVDRSTANGESLRRMRLSLKTSQTREGRPKPSGSQGRAGQG
eukprot:6782148-Pyramimonas_sp.AAC.1